MKIDELLKLNVPDDTIIKLGDQDVKWGDVKANMLGLAQERDGWYQQAQQHQNEAARLSESVAALLQEGTKAAAADRAQPPANPKDMLKQAMSELLKGDEDKDDPYLSPIVERKARKLLEHFRENDLAQTVGPLRAQNEELSKGLQLIAGQLGIERGQRVYEKHEWPQNVDFATATKLAVENRIFVPGTTYPDYHALNEQLTGPARREREIQTIRDEERKKVENDFRSAYGANLVMPNRPGMSFPNSKPIISTDGKSPEQIMDEALRAGIEEALQEGSINGR